MIFRKFRTLMWLVGALGLTAASLIGTSLAKQPIALDFYDRSRVGPLADGRVIVPTNQILSPMGRQVIVGGRPTDVALSPNKRWLAVLNIKEVQIVGVESGKIVSQLAIKGGSYKGIIFSPNGKRVYASTMKSGIDVFRVSKEGQLAAEKLIALSSGSRTRSRRAAKRRRTSGDESFVSGAATTKAALPVGLAISADGKSLYAALNLKNTLAEIDVESGEIRREIPVGNAPYDVVLVGDTAYVSNWAGRLPTRDSATGPSGVAVPVRVDPVRNIANDGSVSVVDLNNGRAVKEIVVGLHPSGLAATPDGKFVTVANASSDTISIIDTHERRVVETISTKPVKDLPFGSAPNALAVSSDGRRLFASNGTNNSIAVIGLAPPHSKLLGCLPTGWYPAGLAIDDKRSALYVANIKGVGSRNRAWEGKRKVNGNVVFGFNTHDHEGTLSLIKLPSDGELAGHTRVVLDNNRLAEIENAMAPAREDVKSRPVPKRHGEPSVFKHVVYIIKENRTYDQVLGDVKKGEGDPQLCIFGEEVTPNEHKLVDDFVLLDNFYCNGVCSADGHQWTDEAYVTDYLEKAFGGWPRSYPYPGGDAMAYAPSGFLWDNVLAHKKSLRVYGEFTTALVRWKDPQRKETPKYLDVYRDFIGKKGQIEVRATPTIKTLEKYLCPTATGFPLSVPDVYRAAQFINELKHYEQKGEFPNLLMVMLPMDHTMGTRPNWPRPESCVANNDLALGQIVKAVSHSKFWPQTCIFVVEDDPQMGFDHVDGHRTVAMVISPYTRRHVVDSTNYNQTSLVRTIELMLGLPPMNQIDASATPMNSCFTDRPDFTPYDAVPNQIPLDRMNPDLATIKNARELHWAQESMKLNLDEEDKADENTFNRILWHARRGRDDTYPAWAVTAEPDD
ncbi:MAG TPA: bifunctional YncE family protein/alkaline phosphatase family protein [Lacipirellulaceae bacterium]|nr:bifunctional YncE family protein/alkaline phosphatase family protein [Lacipirellulaceae bacterium]